MIPKSIFPCKTCGENRYGEVLQQATSYGQSLVTVYRCACCNQTTIENLPVRYSVNKHTTC
jgi:DNA-directed RNA polymerase subunit M/transcription elongation factor TFIIS